MLAVLESYLSQTSLGKSIQEASTYLKKLDFSTGQVLKPCRFKPGEKSQLFYRGDIYSGVYHTHTTVGKM